MCFYFGLLVRLFACCLELGASRYSTQLQCFPTLGRLSSLLLGRTGKVTHNDADTDLPAMLRL